MSRTPSDRLVLLAGLLIHIGRQLMSYGEGLKEIAREIEDEQLDAKAALQEHDE